jgi:hypothetical protein
MNATALHIRQTAAQAVDRLHQTQTAPSDPIQAGSVLPYVLAGALTLALAVAAAAGAPAGEVIRERAEPRTVLLATDMADLGIVPVEVARSRAQEAANELGAPVMARDALTDVLLFTAEPGGGR